MSRLAQFTRFALAGGIAAAANFGSRFVFSATVPYAQAIVLAYLVGMAVAFVLMRRYVFPQHTRPLVQQLGHFTGINLLAVAQTLVVSLVLARWLLPDLVGVERAEALGHAAGIAVPIFTSFLAHRAFTFR